MHTEAEALTLRTDDGATVSALLLAPSRSIAALVLAHGAGAGMRHAFMESLAHELAQRDVASLRFQFPYMESGQKRIDTPAVAQRTVRIAAGEAVRRFAGIPLFAGGKSFGGRMTSQAQADDPLPAVRGLVFVGFPLHPAGKPSTQRADHLVRVDIPMLFLQGTRDTLAELTLVTDVVSRLGDRATLRTFADADHAFHVRAKSGSSDEAVLRALADVTHDWMSRVIEARRDA